MNKKEKRDYFRKYLRRRRKQQREQRYVEGVEWECSPTMVDGKSHDEILKEMTFDPVKFEICGINQREKKGKQIALVKVRFRHI